jgi:2-dehydro-3-deoxyphosphogluconate aldolase/(4S)-4-hydroxy-2-oxoglutarate aldolase
MIQAESLDARMVKLFPSNTLGPAYLDAIRPVFPDLRFMPTGGIPMEEQVITAWLQRGVFAIGGSKLITQHIMNNRLFEKLTDDTKNALQLYNAIQKTLLT